MKIYLGTLVGLVAGILIWTYRANTRGIGGQTAVQSYRKVRF